MVRWALAGLLLGAVVVASVGMAPAFADSPLKQWKAGTMLEEIRCASGTVLVGSPGGRPACVDEQTSKVLAERGWSIVERPEYSKATVIRDTIPVLEEIYYWSKYDVESPPRAQERERIVGWDQVLFPLISPPPSLAWGYHDPPDWLDISNPPHNHQH